MINRFTNSAENALNAALEFASKMGHTYVGSEHILLGLCAESGCTAAKLLESKGVRVAQVEESISAFDIMNRASTASVEYILNPAAISIAMITYLLFSD